MKLILDQFILKTNKLDKMLIVLIFFFPLLLSISIFISDLFATLVAIIILFLILSKKQVFEFYKIKIEIYIFLIFYFLIILSLIFSTSFKESFLPSFFYIRYFLFILGIFYLLKKYDFFDKVLLYSMCMAFFVVLLDATFQYFFLRNFFNYNAIYHGEMIILTSFFGDEKKLGSYLIRLLPILISLFYYFNIKKIHYFYFAFTATIIFLASERTAFFLLIVFSLFHFLIIKKKIQFIIAGLLILTTLFIFNKQLRYKYINFSLMQIGLIETHWNILEGDIIRYYSKEHEDLSYTALILFKNNIFTGSGVKTFYSACNDLKEKSNEVNEDENRLRVMDNGDVVTKNVSVFNRGNVLKCSTHPHNTYFQILSDTGIFTFIFILLFFIFILKKNIKIIFKKNPNNLDICFYFLNVGIILNLLPLIPSGSFFNNWMSLIIFYPLGFWLFVNQKINDNE